MQVAGLFKNVPFWALRRAPERLDRRGVSQGSPVKQGPRARLRRPAGAAAPLGAGRYMQWATVGCYNHGLRLAAPL